MKLLSHKKSETNSEVTDKTFCTKWLPHNCLCLIDQLRKRIKIGRWTLILIKKTMHEPEWSILKIFCWKIVLPTSSPFLQFLIIYSTEINQMYLLFKYNISKPDRAQNRFCFCSIFSEWNSQFYFSVKPKEDMFVKPAFSL